MLRDITLGQYFPGDSCIHRLDARIKIMATLMFIVELFIVDNFIGFLIAAVALGIIIGLSKVPVSFIVRGLKSIMIILVFTFALNMFMVDGRILWQWGFLKISAEGLEIAVFMAIRLVLLLMGSSMLTLCTRPIALTDGIEKLLSPFEKIGLPAHDIAMMMTIALRFIPTLLEEADKIMKAQQARGADFETGNVITRIKSMIPLIIPLFVSSFRIAQDLAMAMEARCYRGGKNRTRMNEMKFVKRDYIAIVLLIVFAAIIIVETRML